MAAQFAYSTHTVGKPNILDDVRVIIVFDGEVNDILGGIVGCLEHSKLVPTGSKFNNLHPWVVQGVLVIDLAATAQSDVSLENLGNLKNLEIFCRSCAEEGRVLNIMLWGVGVVSSISPNSLESHVIHEWPHPTPIFNDESSESAKFRTCTHFKDVHVSLGINWNVNAGCIAFTDGACSSNGKPGARASFAAVITGGQFGAAVVRGMVCSTEYTFVDDEDLSRGIKTTARRAHPSNNRGELLGIIYALLGLIRGCALGITEIITDSKICVDTLLSWLPTRIKKGTDHELKNHDLIMIAWRLLSKLRCQASHVILTHTRSHQRKPPASAPVRVRFVHRGNEIADEHAGEALRISSPVTYLNGPACLA